MTTTESLSVPDVPRPHLDRAAVIRRSAQFQVIATAAIAVGQPILAIEGMEVARPSRFSVQVAEDCHIEVPVDLGLEEAMDRHPWRFLNHSCAPNACLRGRTLVARQPIAVGAEVTFDYHTTEWELASPFRCACGASDCVGEVRGFRHLAPARRRGLAPWLAEHLLARLADVG